MASRSPACIASGGAHDLPRPYRVPGYPDRPGNLHRGVRVSRRAARLIGDPLWTGVTFGVVLAGIPVYYVVFARRGTTAATRGPIS